MVHLGRIIHTMYTRGMQLSGESVYAGEEEEEEEEGDCLGRE